MKLRSELKEGIKSVGLMLIVLVVAMTIRMCIWMPQIF